MERILLILLGALLALWGSIITQRYQNKLLSKKEDRELLHQSFKILVKLEPDLDDFQPSINVEQKELCNELLFNVSKIYNKSYHVLARKLIEFSERDNKKTKENLLYLNSAVQLKN